MSSAAPIHAVRPYFSSAAREFITSHLEELLRTGAHMSNATYCREFASAFAAYHGARYGVACATGSAALELSLRSLAIAGQEVIVPTNTFAATAFAVIASGNIPVFADCGSDLCADPESVASLVNRRTAAVVVVHIGGFVSPSVRELRSICDHHGLALIEDAAHAHGSQLGTRFAGSFGDVSAFSFFSTKVMTTGEGGMLLTSVRELADRAANLLDNAKCNNRNYHAEIGSSWRMGEVQALMGIAQLRELPQAIARRRNIAELYDSVFSGLDTAEPYAAISRGSNYYKYILLPKSCVDREAITLRLRERYGVSLGGPVYEVPLHSQPVFRYYRRDQLFRSEELCARHLCPPIHLGLTDEDVIRAAEAIASSIRALGSS